MQDSEIIAEYVISLTLGSRASKRGSPNKGDFRFVVYMKVSLINGQ